MQKERGARKTTVVQADSSVTLIALSKAQSPFSQAIYIIYILYILVVFGRSTLNSNQTNHIKLCKKLSNHKCSHMSLRLRDSNMNHDIVH